MTGRSNGPPSAKRPTNGQERDRAIFREEIAPYLAELYEAAHRERRYRIAVDDFRDDDLTTEELVGEVLLAAWHGRHRRPEKLGVRVWLLAILFRVAAGISRQEAQHKAMSSVSLEDDVPPDPIYDDDESFWEWYQPDEMTRWEDVLSTSSISPEDTAAADEEFLRALDPKTREVFLLCEVHRVPLADAALALGTELGEAADRLADAHDRLGLTADE